MGKVRAAKREFKKSMKRVSLLPSNVDLSSDSQLKTTMGKISEDISAIDLGLPRAKILKKTNPSTNSNLLSSNFASRIKNLNKQKKKVTFCQSLIVKDLNEQSKSGEDAKHYFKVIHPSAIARQNQTEKRMDKGKTKTGRIAVTPNKPSQVEALIANEEALLSSTIPTLKRIIKKSVKNKKIRLKATRETFKKKMELLRLKKVELAKAKQRQQTVIVGDMHPILDSLPDVPTPTEIEAEIKTAIKEQEQQKRVPKRVEKFSVKKTQQAMLDSLNFFKASGIGFPAGVSSE